MKFIMGGKWYGELILRALGVLVAVVAVILVNGQVAFAATMPVTNTLDSGAGSLRSVIAMATPGDTIIFSVSGVITLTSGQIGITKTLTISGPGANALAVSGNNTSGVFSVTAVSTVEINGLTIKNGNNQDSAGGGGIENHGSLSLANSTLISNTALSQGGGIYNVGMLSVTNSTFVSNPAEYGGGIDNDFGGSLTVTNSTFSGNLVSGSGGGILSSGILSVARSTFWGNLAAVYGGGIYNNLGKVSVINSTFSSNTVNYFGGGIYNIQGTLSVTNSTFIGNKATYYGGGVYNGSSGMLSVTNSIIADSPAGGDCVTAGPTTGSYNLIKNTGANACGLTNNTSGNIIGVDPKLGPLANNGGSTLTYAPLGGSPAINAGDNTACPLFDQRGVKRPQGGVCDIGAVEWLLPKVYLPLVQK